MKKLFLSAMVLLSVGKAYAQPAIAVKFTGADTLVNADTVVKDITLSTTLNGIVLQPVITRISGTAAGKLFFAQSIDGANYITTDSLVLTNILTNTSLITKTQPTALYYRLTFISSGTTVLWPQLWYLPRKEK